MNAGQQGCETCHEVSSWNESRFDHQTTSFALTGKHQTASCGECHITQSQQPDRALVFSSQNKTCSDCHVDPHQGQLTHFGTDGQQRDCQTCHVTRDWFAEKFDHNRQSTFSLEGAHAQAECKACHPVETAGGTSMMRFKPVDSRCEACHLNEQER